MKEKYMNNEFERIFPSQGKIICTECVQAGALCEGFVSQPSKGSVVPPYDYAG